MAVKALLMETLRSGTIASVVIMPLGLLFRALDLRIGDYGPKFAGLFIENPQTWHLLVQHFIIGWLTTLPLLLILQVMGPSRWWLVAGAVYGAVFYVLVNSLALPLYFADPTPWQLGWLTVLPSLIAHIAFGVAIAVTARRFALGRNST